MVVGMSLYALVSQAWELRNSPYFPDALAAILDWYDRLGLTIHEKRQDHIAKVVRLLRQTDPARMGGAV